MFWLQATLLLLLLFLSVVTIIIVNFENSRHLDKQFLEFVQKFNKTYRLNTPEYLERFLIFKKSLETIDQLNSLRDHSESAIYGPTKYSDLSVDEFKAEVLRKSAQQITIIAKKSDIWSLPSNKEYYNADFTQFRVRSKRQLGNIPDKVDWRDKNVISPVQNQGKCGSCWANSVIETIESMVAIKENASSVEGLSVQQMLDCARNNNYGCDGGDTCNLLEWLYSQQVLIETAAAYPTSYENGECKRNSLKFSNTARVFVTDYTCSNLANQELMMLVYLARIGPLVAAVNAQLWQNYLGGIIQFHCNGDYANLNHAVQIVGYDRTGEIPYFIVRNSWGKNFGDNGYLKIEIGHNLCGIATQVSAIDVGKI